ncbi:MAG: ComEA family DNA-binding protein [Mangrovibacterium sp.]
MKKILPLIFFFLIVSGTWAQEVESAYEKQLEDLLEQILAEDETQDVEQLLNELQAIRENPVNLNMATVADLAALYFLTPVQVASLLEYRDQYRPVLSVYELAAVDGFTPELAQLVGQFVVFGEVDAKAPSTYQHHEVLMRGIRLLEKQAGFSEQKYAGSPDKLYLRYRFTSGSVQAGFTAEKDAGEPFSNSPNQNGFDYYSAFVRTEIGKRKSALMVGDYVVRFGQGLAVWQGFSLGKSAEVMQVAKFNQGIRPYTSTDENNFLRGMAAEINLGRFRFHPFFSYKKFDANTDSVGEEKVFTSFQTSGLHRTGSELEDKNSVWSATGGGNLSFRGNRFSVGLTGVHVRYQYPLERRNDLYNQFLFEGDQITNLSGDYHFSVNRLFLFGELATDAKNGLAFLNGALFQPVDQVELSAVYRHIDKQYNAPLAGAFIENSRVNDEQGFYLGMKLFPAARVSVNLYADFFSYQWVKYTTAAPGKGLEYLLQTTYQPNDRWQILGRYFYERKPVKITGNAINSNLDQIRQGVRFQLAGKLDERFSVKTRVEHSFYEHDHWSSGFLISQDVGFQPKNEGINVWVRLAYFNTDDYDARIYAYENDLLYQFSIPALSGEGMRSYLTGKVKFCEKIELWFKVSRSWFFGVDSIGSGYSEIDRNKRTEVKIQLRFRI